MSVQNIFKLFFLAAVWGASFLFIRIVAPSFGPVLTATSRVFIAGFSLLIYFYFIKVDINWKRHWKTYTLIGIINSAFPFVLYAFAALHIPASLSVIINATSPFFGSLFSILIFKEKFSWRQTLSIFLGVAGVALVVKLGKIDNTSTTFYLAVLACLGASACYGLAGNLIKKVSKDINALGISCGSQLGAGLFLILPALTQSAPTNVTTEVILSLITLAVLGSGLAYLLYYQLMADIGPTKALTVTLLMPPFGMLWGYLFLNETITTQMILGTVLILLGTLGVVRKK